MHFPTKNEGSKHMKELSGVGTQVSGKALVSNARSPGFDPQHHNNHTLTPKIQKLSIYFPCYKKMFIHSKNISKFNLLTRWYNNYK